MAAIGITPIRHAGIFTGTGEPANSDLLCTELATYPLGSVYIDKSTGVFYSRTATNKLAADWVGLNTGDNFLNDAAAAAAGIPIGGLYHNAGAVRIRIA